MPRSVVCVKRLTKVSRYHHKPTRLDNQGTAWTPKKPSDILELPGGRVQGSGSQTATLGAAVGLSPESFWFLSLIFLNKMKVMCLRAQEIQKVRRGTKCLTAAFTPLPRSLSLLKVSKIQMPRPHSPELWFSRKGQGLGNCILTSVPGDAWALGVVRPCFSF